MEILWKSFGSRRKSFYTFGYLRKSWQNLRQSSEVVRNLRRSSSTEVFRNVWQPSESVSKSLEIQVLQRRKILCILLKKVGRYKTIIQKPKFILTSELKILDCSFVTESRDHIICIWKHVTNILVLGLSSV